MTINERFKQVRKEMGLSQAKFGEIILFSKGFVAELERGNRKVNERLIKLVCTECFVNEEWLRTGDGEMFKSLLEPQLKQIMESFEGLMPELRECVLSHMDNLLEAQKKLISSK